MNIIRKAIKTIANTDRDALSKIQVTDLVGGTIAVGPRGQYVLQGDDLGVIINGEPVIAVDEYGDLEREITDADVTVAASALLGYSIA